MKFFGNIKKIKLINDFINYIKYKKNENKYHSIFFTENKYTFSYLEENFKSQVKKKIGLISFEKFELDFDVDIYFFQTNIFRQIFSYNKNSIFLLYTPDLNFSLFVKSVYKKQNIFISNIPQLD